MRLVKQLIFGAIYLVILGAVLFWLWPTSLEKCRPLEKCNSLEAPVLQVSFAEPQLFFAAGATAAFAEVKNSGVSAEFSYAINFYDNFDGLVGSLNKKSQFPASSVRLVSAVWPGNATRAEFKVLASRELPAVIFPPSPQVSEVLEISGNSGRLKGGLRSISSGTLRDINIIAVFKNSLGDLLWVGDTVLTELKPYDFSEFVIALPKDENLLKEITDGSREFFIYPTQ
jgi:hypothetical protein